MSAPRHHHSPLPLRHRRPKRSCRLSVLFLRRRRSPSRRCCPPRSSRRIRRPSLRRSRRPSLHRRRLPSLSWRCPPPLHCRLLLPSRAYRRPWLSAPRPRLHVPLVPHRSSSRLRYLTHRRRQRSAPTRFPRHLCRYLPPAIVCQLCSPPPRTPHHCCAPLRSRSRPPLPPCRRGGAFRCRSTSTRRTVSAATPRQSYARRRLRPLVCRRRQLRLIVCHGESGSAARRGQLRRAGCPR